MTKATKQKEQAKSAQKQPKTRLTQGMRASLLRHMNRRFIESFDGSAIKVTLDDLVRNVNMVLRVKFPEEDVAVFRRYEQARRDHCIRFQSASGPRIFMARLEEANGDIVDIPCLRGCYSNETF
jgi:hypothetical protein